MIYGICGIPNFLVYLLCVFSLQIQRTLTDRMNHLDGQLSKLYQEEGPEEAVMFATSVSVETANTIHQQWLHFFGELFVRFRDFHIITEQVNEASCGCNAKEPGLSNEVKKRIIDETGDHYEVPAGSVSPDTKDHQFHRAVDIL